MAGKKGMRHTRLKYSKKLGAIVTDLMEQGYTLSELCSELKTSQGVELFPYTILGWRRHHPEFKAEYEIAYDSRSALWSDELYTIASAPMPLFEDKLQLTAELQRRRLQIDVLKTLLNKHRPNSPTVTASTPKQPQTQDITVNLTDYS